MKYKVGQIFRLKKSGRLFIIHQKEISGEIKIFFKSFGEKKSAVYNGRFSVLNLGDPITESIFFHITGDHPQDFEFVCNSVDEYNTLSIPQSEKISKDLCKTCPGIHLCTENISNSDCDKFHKSLGGFILQSNNKTDNQDILKAGCIEQLRQLRRITWDGNIISKSDLQYLIEVGYATRFEGFSIITDRGIEVLFNLNMLSSK